MGKQMVEAFVSQELNDFTLGVGCSEITTIFLEYCDIDVNSTM
jgi:hypothetical protein